MEVQRKSTLVQTVKDEDDLELIKPADSCFFGFREEVMNKFHQAELFLFQHIQLSEGEGKCEVYVLVGFVFSPVQSELLC